MRKLLLLASFALAAMAFAMPVAAQATGPNISGHEHFEGELTFKVLAGGAKDSTFGCDVTVTVSGNGTTTASVETFEPTTETCVGTKVFAGCELVADEANVPFTAHSQTDHTLTVTKDGGNITVKNTYAGCMVPGSHLEFASVKVTPTPTEGPVSSLHVHGVTTNNAVTAHGTLVAETDTQLTIAT